MANLPPHHSFLNVTNLSDSEIRNFHHMDRALYRRLVIQLGFHPLRARENMAFWLGLELVGYGNIVEAISKFETCVLLEFVREAELCLEYLWSGANPSTLNGCNQIPITAGLVGRALSLQDLNERIGYVINMILNNVCPRIFDDDSLYQSDYGQFPTTFVTLRERRYDSRGASSSGSGGSVPRGTHGPFEVMGYVSSGVGPRGSGDIGNGVPRVTLPPYVNTMIMGPANPFASFNSFVRGHCKPLATSTPNIESFVNPINEGYDHPYLPALMNPSGLGHLNPNMAVNVNPNFAAHWSPNVRSIINHSNVGTRGLRGHLNPNMAGNVNPNVATQWSPNVRGVTNHSNMGRRGLRGRCLASSQAREQPPLLSVQFEGEERTLFLTFSRDHSIDERSIVNFFSSRYGDVVDEIIMRHTEDRSRALFARLVLKSKDMIQFILNGQERVQFRVNRRDVWARAFKPARRIHRNAPGRGRGG
ncbi:hypothetical protein AMTR_s00010p00263370 [Amborella trichopoda]|uniref:RRM domain-containing protein n=1 Tax=Amborella trichopoda TaxID=13333 RepID=W1NH60_AMBTC|nr:hypothetical protein AMTR_s00010p00263370 [Amborella trichopoda]